MDKILSPFIYIIRTIFEAAYGLTNSYGLAVLLLSFAISLLLLPIFIYIEKAKKRDDSVKKRMQPLIDEIKHVYTGQERYYYLQTLNRQFGYSQYKALIPILSLLIQIPFFIAAYQYLDTLEALKGVSFGPLEDLSQPDKLFGIVNVLPVIMTIINIITAYFYTRHGNTSERKQMLVVAAAFLILLFKLPSGLVLYWTMNNLFAFLRLFITNKEVFSRQKQNDAQTNEQLNWHTLLNIRLKHELSEHWRSYSSFFIVSIILLKLFKINFIFTESKLMFKFIEQLIIASNISIIAAIINSYANNIKTAIIKIPSYIVGGLLAVSSYLYLASLYNYKGVNQDLALMSLVLSLILQLVCVVKIYPLRQLRFRSFFQYILVFCALVQAFLFIAIKNKQLLAILNIELNKYNSKLQGVALFALIFIFVALPLISKTQTKSSAKTSLASFLLSILFLSGYILLWNPLITFSTYPEAFQFGVTSILNSGLILMAQIVLALLIVYLVLPKNIRSYFSILALCLVIISIVHSSIIPLNVGTLQGLNFSKSDALDTPYLEYLLEAVCMVGLFFLCIYMYKKNKTRSINRFLIILNLGVISHAAYAISTKQLHKVNEGEKIVSISNNIEISNHKISLSKDKENVIVIMLDMIEGWFFQRYLDENSRNKDAFKGFTYYPNTVSSTNYTGGSMPGLIGGYNFAPLLLDQDKEHTLAQKMLMAAENLRDKAQKNGYFYTCSDLPYCKIDKRTYDRHIPIWSDEWEPIKQVLNIGETRNIGVEILRYNALFFCAPLLYKTVIYDNGSWNIQQKSINEHNDMTRHYNSLRVLPYITDDSANDKTFTFLSYKATHFPWDKINKDGSFVPNVTPYENNKWGLEVVADWLKVLKTLNVYDNTRIIIASDHGLRHVKDTASVMYNHPYENINYDRVPFADMLNFSALLLVKDFDSSGSIVCDSTLMSTIDVQNISFNGNKPLYINGLNNRDIEAVKISWEIKMYEHTTYPILRHYKIKNDLFDLDNWSRVK